MITMNRFLEIGAAIFTLIGMYVGSTTLFGASMYFISVMFWHTLTYRTKMWGLVPLNVAANAIAIFNIWRAYS